MCSSFITRGHLVGIDASVSMANSARAALPQDRVDVQVGRLEDPLPKGRFDLVVSALAVHHLPAAGKADLFARIASALRPGGIFVLGDVVVPQQAEDQVTPLEAGVDLPDCLDDQLDGSWTPSSTQLSCGPKGIWRSSER